MAQIPALVQFAPNTIIKSAEANSNNTSIRNTYNAHDIATTGVHGLSGDIVGTSDTQTLSNKTLDSSCEFEGTIADWSARVETVGFGEAGTEPDIGVYSLTIGGEVYYVPTIDINQNEQITFKCVVPGVYKTGDQILLRVGYTDDNAGIISHAFDSWFALVDENDVIDTGLNTHTNVGDIIASTAIAAEFKFSEVIEVTDASGEMNGVAVVPGDVIVGKIERTNADATDFRFISLEMKK